MVLTAATQINYARNFHQNQTLKGQTNPTTFYVKLAIIAPGPKKQRNSKITFG